VTVVVTYPLTVWVILLGDLVLDSRDLVFERAIQDQNIDTCRWQPGVPTEPQVELSSPYPVQLNGANVNPSARMLLLGMPRRARRQQRRPGNLPVWVGLALMHATTGERIDDVHL
jgi:hypothetical protein